MSEFKEKVRGLNKAKILKLLFSLMDECDAISTKNCMLKDTCSKLKRDVQILEKTKQELEQANEILMSEQDNITFALGRDVNMLKELMNKREEVFNTDLSKVEEESRELELKIELLVSENNQLPKKVHKAESDLVHNRHRSNFSEALRIEALINKSSQLLEKLHKAESDLV